MKRLLAVLERIATALEQLVPALTQATREARYDKDAWTTTGYIPPDPRYPEDDHL